MSWHLALPARLDRRSVSSLHEEARRRAAGHPELRLQVDGGAVAAVDGVGLQWLLALLAASAQVSWEAASPTLVRALGEAGLEIATGREVPAREKR